MSNTLSNSLTKLNIYKINDSVLKEVIILVLKFKCKWLKIL